MFMGSDPKVAYVSTFLKCKVFEEKRRGKPTRFVNYCLFSREYGKL